MSALALIQTGAGDVVARFAGAVARDSYVVQTGGPEYVARATTAHPSDAMGGLWCDARQCRDVPPGFPLSGLTVAGASLLCDGSGRPVTLI